MLKVVNFQINHQNQASLLQILTTDRRTEESTGKLRKNTQMQLKSSNNSKNSMKPSSMIKDKIFNTIKIPYEICKIYLWSKIKKSINLITS